MKIDVNKLEECSNKIQSEYFDAKQKHKPFHNLHEAYAIMKEEFDEFWEIVKLKQSRNPTRVRRAKQEALQIAAMALGVLYEFDE